jgi:hypothetical protein
MEAIRPDEGPVLKTGGGKKPLVSSSLTASALWKSSELVRNLLGRQAAADMLLVGSSPGTERSLVVFRFRGHGPTGRRWLRKPEIRVRFPVTPLEDMVPWSNGHDAWSTPRKRWFNSVRGYC